MKFLPRFIKKIVKMLLAGAFTIIVAACYGVYMDYRYLFHVSDPQGTPLQNINVTLMDGEYIEGEAVTDQNGEALIDAYNSSSLSESTVEFNDVDGIANGGHFQSKTMEVNGSNGDIVEYNVTLDPVK